MHARFHEVGKTRDDWHRFVPLLPLLKTRLVFFPAARCVSIDQTVKINGRVGQRWLILAEKRM